MRVFHGNIITGNGEGSDSRHLVEKEGKIYRQHPAERLSSS